MLRHGLPGAAARAVAARAGVALALTAWSCSGGAEEPTGPAAPEGPVVFTPDGAALAAADTTATGLVFIPIEVGTGRRPGRGSLVSVHYTGMLEDLTVFDSSYPVGQPFRFVLGQGRVIDGWDEGIALMREGDRARLVIPPSLAYGDSGAGAGVIPPGATLIFDVWLVDVD